MGLTSVTVVIRGLGRRRPFHDQFLVDTGAIDTFAPASALRRAGIRPVGKSTYELADGTAKEYEYGLAQITFMGETTAGRVIFGPEGTEPLLGVTALESVGIMVDPARRTLARLPAIPLKPGRRPKPR